MKLADRCAQRDAARRTETTIYKAAAAARPAEPGVWARLVAHQGRCNARTYAEFGQARDEFAKAGQIWRDKIKPGLKQAGAELAQAYREDTFTRQARYDANGTPHCPHCGGITFRARRRRGDIAAILLTLGVAALYVSRDKVECTACRKRFNNR